MNYELRIKRLPSSQAKFSSSFRAERSNLPRRFAKILASALFAFLALPAFSISKDDFSLELEPLFGLKSGQADEYVFLKHSNYDDDKLSELNWEFDHEFYGGLKINAGFKNIFLETSFSAGIPETVGTMKDSDWKNLTYSQDSMAYYQTNYSESDNSLEYDFSYKIKAGYAFNLPKFKQLKTSIKPFVGYQYKFFKFNGKNGTAWYGNAIGTRTYDALGPYYKYDDEENQSILDFSGQRVISYKRQNSIFWIGLDAEFTFFDDFIFTTGFKASPYLYCESVDNHHKSSTDYLDVTPGYFAAFNWNLGAEYKITARQSICLNAEYFYMRVLRGDDYQKNSSYSKFKESDKDSYIDGGAAEHYLTVSLSYKLKLL